MIPREELEFTLAMAEKGLRSETPPEVMAELCRVYLAWVDAPETVLVECADPEDGVTPTAEILDVFAECLIGKRVKLVEVE